MLIRHLLNCRLTQPGFLNTMNNLNFFYIAFIKGIQQLQQNCCMNLYVLQLLLSRDQISCVSNYFINDLLIITGYKLSCLINLVINSSLIYINIKSNLYNTEYVFSKQMLLTMIIRNKKVIFLDFYELMDEYN